MKVSNATRWCKPSRIHCYLYALIILATVFCLRLFLHPLLGKYMPYQLFFYAACLTAFYLGGGPSALIVILGNLLGSYFFVEPELEFTSLNNRDIILITNYLASSLFVIIAIEYLQRARYKSELLLLVAESRYKTMLQRENQRLLLERHNKNITKS